MKDDTKYEYLLRKLHYCHMLMDTYQGDANWPYWEQLESDVIELKNAIIAEYEKHNEEKKYDISI